MCYAVCMVYVGECGVFGRGVVFVLYMLCDVHVLCGVYVLFVTCVTYKWLVYE